MDIFVHYFDDMWKNHAFKYTLEQISGAKKALNKQKGSFLL